MKREEYYVKNLDVRINSLHELIGMDLSLLTSLIGDVSEERMVDFYLVALSLFENTDMGETDIEALVEQFSYLKKNASDIALEEVLKLTPEDTDKFLAPILEVARKYEGHHRADCDTTSRSKFPFSFMGDEGDVLVDSFISGDKRSVTLAVTTTGESADFSYTISKDENPQIKFVESVAYALVKEAYGFEADDLVNKIRRAVLKNL